MDRPTDAPHQPIGTTVSDAAAVESRARRTWRDAGFFVLLCVALATPLVVNLFSPIAPSVTPTPATVDAIAAFVPLAPRDAIDRQALATAQQGVVEVLEMRDSSAPAPVFDPQKVRVEHPSADRWVASGVVTTAWQMLMASPHIYRAEVYRLCHLLDPSCFKVRGVTFDSQTLLDPGPEKPARP